MEDFFADLYDDDERSNKDGDPTFSFYEFKKWLSKENKKAKEEKVSDEIKREKKSELKEKLKQRIKDKVRKRRKENEG